MLGAYGAVYVIWGSTFLGIRYAVETIPPFLMAGSRFVVAGVVLYAVLRLRGTSAPSRRQWAAAALIGLLLIAVGNGGVSWAEQFIPSSLAALLIAAEPLWIALLEGGRTRRMPPPRAWLGIALGVLGVALLVGVPQGWDSGAPVFLATIVVVAASWAWAAGSVLSRVVARPQSALMSASMHMLAGGAALMAAGFFSGEMGAIGEITLLSAAAWAYLIVFGSIVGFAAYVWLLQVDSPTRVATHAYVNPLIAVLLGWAVAAEPLSPQMLASGAAIIMAVILILRTQRRPAFSEIRPHPSSGTPAFDAHQSRAA